MKKSNIIQKNWPKYLLQWGIITALVVVLTGIVPSKEPIDAEAYCPVGGIQALSTYIVRDSLPCSMSPLQIVMGVLMLASVVLVGKLFCGYVCPVGTVEDLLRKLRRKLRIVSVNVKNGSVLDAILRIVKYGMLFWIFYTTVTSSELFCKLFDPYYAVATGFQGEITLWVSIVSISVLIIGSFFIDMFWCKYLCPVGAMLNSMKFWVWVAALVGVYYGANLLGLSLEWYYLLGAFCILGYLLEILCRKPKLQLLHVIKNDNACNGCGLCNKECPYGIDIKTLKSGAVKHVDCTLCGDCVASCRADALAVGVCKKSKGGLWKIVPALLTVGLILFGISYGDKYEIPTIDVQWGMEGQHLEELEIEGLRSVKCYGSSMAFKAKLEKVTGVYRVKTYSSDFKAKLYYNPKETTPEQIQKAIYIPSKFRVQTPDLTQVDSVRVITLRTENMHDKLDINYLGMHLRASGRKIYGIETEYDCPIIVRVYVDPTEEFEEKWFKEMVEVEVISMPVHGGGTNDIEVNYKFVEMEDEISYISVEELVRKLFNPFVVNFKARAEKFAGQDQFVYEIPNPDYEKPIYNRNMPYLSNHLSKHDGIIGVSLLLNNELVPTIGIRYAAPMTPEKVWELITMETWKITFAADDIREVPAKIHFEQEGVVKPYVVE